MQDPTTQLTTPHLGVHSCRLDSSLLKDTKEGASAAAAGSLLQSENVRGKKLHLKQLVDCEFDKALLCLGI